MPTENETFVCTCGCGEEIEGPTYREFLNTWKRPPICRYGRMATSNQSSVWRRKVGQQPVLDMSDTDCRPIRGYTGYYVHRDGRVTRGRTDVLRTRQLPKKVPFVVAVVRDDGTRSCLCVGREVARAFSTEFIPAMHIGYRDGNPANCALTNLVFNTWREWCKTCRGKQEDGC